MHVALGALVLRMAGYGALPLLHMPSPWLLLPLSLLNVSDGGGACLPCTAAASHRVPRALRHDGTLQECTAPAPHITSHRA